jgi:plastocyanin
MGIASVTAMSLAIISSDKVVFALAFGIPIVVLALIFVWGRPRKWQAVWALVSLAAIAGTGIAAWAAFHGKAPQPPALAITTPASSAAASPPPGTSPPPTAPPSTVPPTTSTPAACTPDGTKVKITAHLIKFDTDCLAAPADTVFTITFTNEDAGIPHNIHIFTADPSTDPNAQTLFDGDLVPGPGKTNFDVSAIPAGTYFFHCDVHPTEMTGTFVSG